ncbi:MAG: hypothetical protein LJF30_07270 [Acidobacteria bacterium]|nr:hypothetical protein [Acidobacteriota bacterium]
MKLDAWMEQDHPLDERLRLIAGLCQAVNEVHDRGEALGALQPDRVEVDPGGHCDISGATGGSPSPDYAPPDGEGDAASDVFAAGMIAWEVLAGRSAGDSPRHLAEVRPDIPKELADAIMACLERSADWRPKDLTFLAQMAAARLKSGDRPAQRRRATRSPRRSPGRARSRREGRRTWPLLAALVVVLGLAFFAWQQFGGIDGFPWNRTASEPAVPPPAPPVTEPVPPVDTALPPVDTPTAAPVTEGTTGEEEVASAAAAPQVPPPSAPAPAIPPETESAPPPPPATTPAPAAAPPPVQTAPAEPPPSTRPAPAEPPPTSRPAPATPPVVAPAPVAPPRPAPNTSGAARPAAPAPSAEVQPAPPAPAEPPPTLPPAVLTAVSPLEVKRPGKVLVDLRGQGFQEQHRVRVLPVRKAPRGITVVRQKRVNDTLITVLLDLSEDADTGDYALALENGLGERTESVVFKVTK